MDLRDACQKADQILDEERIHPTISYGLSKAALTALGGMAALASWMGPNDRGKQHPRIVRVDPEEHQFKSVNFDLLCAVFDQVREQDRPTLFASLRSRILDTKSYRHKHTDLVNAGSWAWCSSELPLVAEFLTRRGDKQLFIAAIFEAAISPGLTLLLLQLEEMIALNFTLFTEEEYTQIPRAIATIENAVNELKGKPKPADTIRSNTRFHMLREVPRLCSSIVEECRSSRYLYTKGSLLPGMNLEVNQDKSKVQTFLKKLGFTQLLIESLDEAEKLYRTAATPFELKSCLGHLRSFVEHLHLQACVGARQKYGGSLPLKWGDALKYLVDHNLLTKQEDQFFSSLYTLVSDTGVHPLIADREYARLMRNMSIECGLLLLTKLDRLGVDLATGPVASTAP